MRCDPGVPQCVLTRASEVISGALSGRVTPFRVGSRGLDDWDIDPQHCGRRVTVVAPAVQLGAQEGERITRVQAVVLALVDPEGQLSRKDIDEFFPRMGVRFFTPSAGLDGDPLGFQRPRPRQ